MYNFIGPGFEEIKPTIMARTSTIVTVGKRKIDLSNLRKVLFPADGIVKAELIEYYLKIAPTILRHIKGRPLTLVRWPDGVDHGTFFQKNRPEWAPMWLEHVVLGGKEDKVDYVLATEEASLVWLANLACMELHQMHCRTPHYDKPDYIVWDLDPPEKYPFTKVVELAFDLREHIERYGYHTFVKTTGGKGVHIVAPIDPKWSFELGREAALLVAKAYIEKHDSTTTLQIKKEARKGRVLIDVYRNNTYQTIISPYSVRGRDRAPVSMPLTWERLESVEDPSEFNLRNVPDLILENGDPWETIDAYAIKLHTQKPKNTKPSAKKTFEKNYDPLSDYARKRAFDKTPEPGPEIFAGENNAFVVHRHHATRLHYDVRLERDGTLKCWAVPKGLPPRPGIKRMAVQTEDHPVKYLDFEGTIPKGEYGGGDMWIFARGRYEITKEKKDGFYFRFQSREWNDEYRMIHTKGKDWLCERLVPPQIDWLRDPIEPMLSENRDKPFDSPDFLYEVKWDGIRAMVALDEGKITIRSRAQRDITNLFPELQIPDQAFRAACGLFDVEIVCLNEKGQPIFEDVLQRLHPRNEAAVARARAKHPAVCYVFDCLYVDGRPIVNESLARRRAWMVDSIKVPNPAYRPSETVDNGTGLFEAAAAHGLEGIMAKERNSIYMPGKRTSHWFKIKKWRTAECVIIGYTKGKGEREATFGALQLGMYRGNHLVYVGKVGTGFDDRTSKIIIAELQKLKRIQRPVKEKPLDDSVTVWLEPQLVCEVQYSSLASTGNLREPVFLRLRPDKAPEDCVIGS
jgi:DNA ligase D-like protein (predicted ligase)/DNA ligase D-like protein (predicted polymerase)/DNA ligase D-like protein (predicted 3'-phosphoesterase)